MIDKEFIERATLLSKDGVNDLLDKRRKNDRIWRDKNKIKFNNCVKKYERSEKGKLARARAIKKRRIRERKAYKGMTEDDLFLMQEFYNNRPDGYHVDHIIPLFKGGTHHVSNLQYLLPEENLKKSYK